MAKYKTKISKLKKLFAKLDPDLKTLAEPLLQEFAFMDKTLDELKGEIEEHGAIITDVNGNGFTVLRENPAKKSYDAMYKNYAATWNKIVDLLPKSEQQSNELLDFVNRR